MRVLLASLLFFAAPTALAIAHPHGMRQGIRPRVKPISPAIDSSAAPDASLHAVRTHMTQIRKLKRKAKLQAMRISLSSYQTAESVYGDMQEYSAQLATLDDIQRALVRSARAGVLREQRAAERKWRDWLNRREQRLDEA